MEPRLLVPQYIIQNLVMLMVELMEDLKRSQLAFSST